MPGESAAYLLIMPYCEPTRKSKQLLFVQVGYAWSPGMCLS